MMEDPISYIHIGTALNGIKDHLNEQMEIINKSLRIACSCFGLKFIMQGP